MPIATQAGSTVTGASIVDGTISNDDIATNANIDATKISLAAAIGTTELEESVLQTATVTISSAEILALHTTPKTLIAAPGAGKLIVVQEVVWSFTVGTLYLLGDALRVQYNSDTTVLVSLLNNTILQAGSSSVNKRLAGNSATSNDVALTAGTNKSVEVGLSSATAYTTGTGTLKAFVTYRIITL